VDRFYETYYTHEPSETRAARRAAERAKLAERVRVRIAWTLDGGADMDADFIHNLVGGRPSKICDLGCGDGSLIAALKARGHAVAGVEPDPTTLKLAKARGLDVYQGYADSLPEPVASSQYDLVMLNHVLHLCLDPLSVVRNARKLLRPGGLFVCETTNNECWGLRQQGACWRWLDMPRHLDLFTGRSLQRVVDAAGLRVKALDFTGYTRQFKAAWLDDQAQKSAMLYPSRSGNGIRQVLQSWILLVRTALAKPERKYDSVRVVAEAVG
jgi:SAM-dependent methyltransferase